MIDIALKMLFGERAKYAMLVSGICFAAILMTQGLALFLGILSVSYSTATNVRAPIWVVDPLVQQVSDNQPLRDTDVDRVRSVGGVAWAAPLYVGVAQAKLLRGDTQHPIRMEFVRIEPYISPKRNLTGLSSERVDTRVLQVIYKFSNNPAHPIYVGQQMGLFIEESPVDSAQQQLGRTKSHESVIDDFGYGFLLRNYVTNSQCCREPRG